MNPLISDIQFKLMQIRWSSMKTMAKVFSACYLYYIWIFIITSSCATYCTEVFNTSLAYTLIVWFTAVSDPPLWILIDMFHFWFTEFCFFILGHERLPEQIGETTPEIRHRLIERCNHLSEEVKRFIKAPWQILSV